MQTKTLATIGSFTVYLNQVKGERSSLCQSLLTLPLMYTCTSEYKQHNPIFSVTLEISQKKQQQLRISSQYDTKHINRSSFWQGDFWIEVSEFCLEENLLCVMCSTLSTELQYTVQFDICYGLRWAKRRFTFILSNWPDIYISLCKSVSRKALHIQFTFHFNRFWHNCRVTFTIHYRGSICFFERVQQP